MALQRDMQKISLPAAGDLSTLQFHIMLIDSAGRASTATGTASKVVGVLQNKPAALGMGAEIAYSGVCRMVAGASVAPGDLIVSDGAGFGIAGTGTGSKPVGMCISTEANASGLIFECLLLPGAVI